MHFKFVSLYNVLVLLDSLDFLYYRDKQAKKILYFSNYYSNAFIKLCKNKLNENLKTKHKQYI